MREQRSILPLIHKKKAGMAFTREEIIGWVRDTGEGRIPDYQLAALLMAICFRGMTPEETADLTLAMAASGEMIDLSTLGGICVDKHSTGGVGDTTTLVLTPLVAACGAKVAKMSGRGLGHTGGTLDKMESIAGLQTEMARDAFIRQVREIGCAVISQSETIVPTDKALYRLRDVTATVDSVPLIVSSIMSKKIASGSQAIVLDVKTGNGALMHSLEDSIALAESMVAVGQLAGRQVTALVTGMDQPLGTHIGNALEVKEAIDILAGRAGGRLLTVSLRLGAMMLVAAGCAATEAEAKAKLEDALTQRRGLAKLSEMIAAQGGDPRVTADVGLLPMARRITPVLASKAGYVTEMDTTALGEASQWLGAGRMEIDDAIDPAVGIVMAVELGDRVAAGQTLAFMHINDEANVAEATARVRDAICVSDGPKPLPPLVYAVVRPDGVQRFS